MKALREVLRDYFWVEQQSASIYDDTPDPDVYIIDGSINLREIEKIIEAWIKEGVEEFARSKGIKSEDVMRRITE